MTKHRRIHVLWWVSFKSILSNWFQLFHKRIKHHQSIIIELYNIHLKTLKYLKYLICHSYMREEFYLTNPSVSVFTLQSYSMDNLQELDDQSTQIFQYAIARIFRLIDLPHLDFMNEKTQLSHKHEIGFVFWSIQSKNIIFETSSDH